MKTNYWIHWHNGRAGAGWIMAAEFDHPKDQRASREYTVGYFDTLTTAGKQMLRDHGYGHLAA